MKVCCDFRLIRRRINRECTVLGTIRSHYTGTSMYFGDGPWKIFAWCNLNSSLHLKMLPPNATATNLHVHPLWYNLSVARHFCACAQILDVHKNTSVLARQLYRYPLQRRRRRRWGPGRYTPVGACEYRLREELSLIFWTTGWIIIYAAVTPGKIMLRCFHSRA